MLAHHFKTEFIPEYAREYIDRLDRPYKLSDIEKIAKKQFDAIINADKREMEICIIDTELLVTRIWALHAYKTCPEWISEKIPLQNIDLYLLCYIDAPWIPDHQREHPHLRKYLYEQYYQELMNFGFPFKIVKGIGNARFNNALEAINDHLNL